MTDNNYINYINTKSKYLDLKNNNSNNDKSIINRLKIIKSMNFEGFNKRNWNLVSKILDVNVVTIFSNGMKAHGIEPSIDILMRDVTQWAPDTKIKKQPINFGSGDWTCTSLIIEGTFTKAITSMGPVIEPTGRKFTMNNCSIVHWSGNKISKFYIFSNSFGMMKQLGTLEIFLKTQPINQFSVSNDDSLDIDDSSVIHDNGNGNSQVKQNLANLQKLNFDGFNKRNWDLVRNMFDLNLISVFSYGDIVQGPDLNIEFMKQSLSWSPDTHVKHRIQFGHGDLVCMNIIVTGTFTKPMKIPDGTIIQPSGKKYVNNHCSISKWKNGKVVRSDIFMDQGDIMMQLGIKNMF